MRKNLFSLEEIMPSNIYKNAKDYNAFKNKEKLKQKSMSVSKIKKTNKSKINNIQQNNRQIDYSKTPVKIMGKLKLHKFANSFNECKKNNNSNNVLCFSTNGKQMLLLEYFLQNNKRNVKTNIYLIGSKKEEMKNLNKVTKSLFPMKRHLFNSKQQNTRYFNNNNNQKNFKNNFNKQKENITIKKNGNKIFNKKEKTKEVLKQKDEDSKNNNAFISKHNTITNNIVHKSSFNNKIKNKEEKKDFNSLKTSVNLSKKKNEIEKSNNQNSKREIKEIKTPNNIFKNKIMNILSECNNSNDINEHNRSENLLFFNKIPIRGSSGKQGNLKSNSLEKYLNHKSGINNLSTKSLFNLTNFKRRNQSENSLLINKNPKKSDGNSNAQKMKKNIKENKSCDTFFHKKNSVSVEKVNIKIIRNNKDNISQKSNNISNKGSTKQNYFHSIKMMKKFKKHKSLDFNSKHSLNGLMISQNEIKDLLFKKDNKTPEKDPSFLNIHLENNNNKPSNIKKILNYTYNIIPGNNKNLIERCLLNRRNWIASNEDKKDYSNLIWTPLSSQINYGAHSLIETVQFVNHFEYHNELTNKSKTFINLLRYCEFNDIDLFSFYPLTIIFSFNSNSLNSQIEKFKKLYNEIPSLICDEKDIKKENEEDNDSSTKLYSKYFTVNLSKKLGSFQKIYIPKTHYAGKNLWLLKRDNLNRGRKIKVFSKLDDILKEINDLNEKKFPKNLLIQKYIEQPLLYNKRKFDIRIWVLFTYLEQNKKYEVFIFKEGHLKACCDNYDINSEDLFIHLTNYSVQKHNKNFSKSEIGNEISFADFQKELDKTGKNIDFKKKIFPEIIQIVQISANSVKGKINLSKRSNCFEIFGYDFILDINFKPYLLEINTNPGYEESSPLIKMLVPRMIDDAMKLTIDKEFESSYKSNLEKLYNFSVEGYSSEENMWLKIKTIL